MGTAVEALVFEIQFIPHPLGLPPRQLRHYYRQPYEGIKDQLVLHRGEVRLGVE
jgi:hypothetical protein